MTNSSGIAWEFIVSRVAGAHLDPKGILQWFDLRMTADELVAHLRDHGLDRCGVCGTWYKREFWSGAGCRVCVRHQRN
jgi:hypothetical protein